ncbi:MAG: hypothetical protein U5K74_05650 [Gemmatimonadaceae bacterium]|nr:hypothetical protein [Gemmatimonadaceae bacterium]
MNMGDLHRQGGAEIVFPALPERAAGVRSLSCRSDRRPIPAVSPLFDALASRMGIIES